MGGNATAYIKASGKSTKAQKIPVSKIGRTKFIKTLQALFTKLNQEFQKKYNRKIWEKEEILQNGKAFNGSTSYIMNPDYTDADVEKYKPSAGDLDIAVDETLKKDFSDFLEAYEDKEIIPGVRYMGKNPKGPGDQINGVFIIEFSKDLTVACQIDFEFLPYENGEPTEWARFSHSSSFDDQKENVKAVFHKYAIRALIGVIGIRDDIVIATGKSTPEKITLSSSKVHEIPRMYKFSVARGIRTAYEPMIDPKTGEIITMDVDGKKKMVFKEVPVKDSKFIANLEGIMQMAFGLKEISGADKKAFWSMNGVCNLMKKYLSKGRILLVQKRFEELLWGVKPQYAQEIEMNDPVADYQIKLSGYKKFISTLSLKDHSKELAKDYYQNWTKEGNKEEVLKIING